MTVPKGAIRPGGVDWGRAASTTGSASRVIAPREGALTMPLAKQRRLFKFLVNGALRAGCMPRAAVERAADAMTWLRDRALEHDWDSEMQYDVAQLTAAAFVADGVTRGQVLAARAIETARIAQEQLVAWRKEMVARAGKGEP